MQPINWNLIFILRHFMNTRRVRVSLRFEVILEAPTAAAQRAEESPLTYLNKGTEIISSQWRCGNLLRRTEITERKLSLLQVSIMLLLSKMATATTAT